MKGASLLSFDNVVFSQFAFYATVVVIKLFLMAFITTVYRISKKVFANPEDLKIVPRSGKLKPILNDIDVERVRRNHLNDLENIPAFLFLGLLYVLTEPATSSAVLHFRIFAASRILHTISYQMALPQPSRGICFVVGLVVCLSMAIQILMAAQP